MVPVKLDDLNPAQYEAVTAGDGPILILAGAGSGKTRVLTYRIAYLLTERKLAPEQLLAVTFTNKAAAEMRERLTALLGAHASRLWIATFHSACARILRQDIERLGYRRNFTVFDESDSASTINRAIEAANLSGRPQSGRGPGADRSGQERGPRAGRNWRRSPMPARNGGDRGNLSHLPAAPART